MVAVWVFLGGQEGSLGLRQPFYHHEVSVWIERDTERDRNIMRGRKREEWEKGEREQETLERMERYRERQRERERREGLMLTGAHVGTWPDHGKGFIEASSFNEGVGQTPANGSLWVRVRSGHSLEWM